MRPGMPFALARLSPQSRPKSLFQRMFANGELGDVWEPFRLSSTIDATVASVTGLLGRHVFAQATEGSKPILKARADGVRYLDFSSSKTMQVSTSTDKFKFLHDGTGGTILALVEWPQSEAASNFLTTCTATSQVGVTLSKSSTTQNGAFNVNRGVSGQVAATSTIAQMASSSRLRMIRVDYKNNAAADDLRMSLDMSLSATNAATSLAPSTANSSGNLTVSSTFVGRLYALLVINRRLSQAEIWNVYSRWIGTCAYHVPTPDLTLAIGGQSNASGRGTILPTTVEQMVGAYAYSKNETYSLAFEPSHSLENQPIATTPTEPQTPGHSFVLGLGRSLFTNSAKKTIAVPCSVGSTTISDWAKPAVKQDRTTLFGAMDYRMSKVLREKGGTPVFVWYGHEGSASLAVPDYVNGGVGTDYQAAWATLVSDLRTEIANAPMIFCQLSANYPSSDTSAGGAEAQRQTELTVANSFMVVTHDLARNADPDGIHLSRAGQDPALVARVDLAIRQHILGEEVNGTGPRIVGATYSSAVVTLTMTSAVDASASNYGSLFRVYDAGVEATVSSAARNADTTKIDITCSAPLTGPVTLTYGYRPGAQNGAARTDIVKDVDGLPLPVFGPIAVTAA